MLDVVEGCKLFNNTTFDCGDKKEKCLVRSDFLMLVRKMFAMAKLVYVA